MRMIIHRNAFLMTLESTLPSYQMHKKRGAHRLTCFQVPMCAYALKVIPSGYAVC